MAVGLRLYSKTSKNIRDFQKIRVKQQNYDWHYNRKTSKNFKTKEIRDLLLIELTHTRRNTSKTLLTKKYETSPNQIRVTIIKYE